MAFADQLPKDGRALVWLLEMSTDKFATVSYRWASSAGDYGGSFFEARIIGLGNIKRALGVDHMPVAATTTVILDNTDFGIDFLASQATIETTVFAARFRLSIGLSDDTANTYQATVLTQTIGTFVCLDMPVREDGRVTMTLADDAIGDMADLLPPPTIDEWIQSYVGGSDSTFPGDNVTWSASMPPMTDFNAPAPLQFGMSSGYSPFMGIKVCGFTKVRAPADYDLTFFRAGSRPYIYPILICATRATGYSFGTQTPTLTARFRNDVIGSTNYRGQSLQIPAAPANGSKIWKSYLTDAIAKVGPDGVSRDWRFLWVAFDMSEYLGWFVSNQTPPVPTSGWAPQQPPLAPEYKVAGSPTPQAPVWPLPLDLCNAMFAAFECFAFTGGQGSEVYGATIPEFGNAANIIRDLITSYSVMGATAIDATRFTRAALKRQFRVRGEVVTDATKPAAGQVLAAVQSPFGVGNLRKAIAEICATADLDCFVTMSGQVAIAGQQADFETQTTTYPSIDEERINNVKDHSASQAQRWAPYNRVYVQRRSPWYRPNSDLLMGPFDNPTAITAWKRIITKIIDGKWWQDLQTEPGLRWLANQADPTSIIWATRQLEAKARPIIEFSTDVGILALELADYFTMSWTRGGVNSAYASALWRLESVDIQPDGRVMAVAVWMGDLQTSQPYLLDSEALLVVAATGAATLTVTDGSTTVTRSAGSFITAGLTRGDILRLRDSSEAASGFTRNRDVRVNHVVDAVTVELDPATDTDFGTAGAHVIAAADWSMLHGATSYPTSSSDPANYPSGGAMYGKASDASGLFSDGSPANKLMDG